MNQQPTQEQIEEMIKKNPNSVINPKYISKSTSNKIHEMIDQMLIKDAYIEQLLDQLEFKDQKIQELKNKLGESDEEVTVEDNEKVEDAG